MIAYTKPHISMYLPTLDEKKSQEAILRFYCDETLTPASECNLLMTFSFRRQIPISIQPGMYRWTSPLVSS